MEDKDLTQTANVVDRLASENSDIGIPVDPDVADHMGAFVEDAVNLDDLDAEEKDYERE